MKFRPVKTIGYDQSQGLGAQPKIKISNVSVSRVSGTSLLTSFGGIPSGLPKPCHT